MSLELPFRVLDAAEEVLIFERKLPHWTQPGTLTFITFRTWDSMPAAVVQRWVAERDQWLKVHGIDGEAPNWRDQLATLDATLRREFHRCFSSRWHEELDRCHGACVLRQPKYACEVADSLLHFDGDRYELTDFVTMPNHVHVMAAFYDEQAMLKQCESWKHFTAARINRCLNRKGRFWQQDGFDHLVRSVDQFDYLRRYIAENPKKAHLREGEYVHFSKPL